MATVYLAQDIRHDRRVALKVLRPELAAVIGADRFLAEIRTTAQLQHPGILPLFDSGEAASQLFYVMPYVEGESLRARLDRERQLPIGDAVRLASEVGEALAYAHEHDVVHRDIKPDNILLQAGRPLVADFGIALAVQSAGGNRLTQTGLSLGTPQYMSPEQAAGERNVDGRTDQYALAAVLYEMLAGDPPFTAPSTQALIAKLMTEEARPLATLRKSVPNHVDAAVQRALEKLPADRFATTRDFVRALAGDMPVVRAAATAKQIDRPWIPIAVGLLALGAGVGAAIDHTMRRSATAPGAPVVRFAVDQDSGQQLSIVCCGNIFVVAPDSRRIAFQAVDRDLVSRIHVRELDDVGSRSLTGTDDAHELFFSPDGESIGFSTGRSLRTVELRSGIVRTVAALPPKGFTGGGTWTDDGRIIYTVGNTMFSAPAGGGAITELYHGDTAKSELQFAGPHFVRAANAVLFAVQQTKGEPHVRILWLANGRTKVVAPGIAPHFVSNGGWLLVARSDGTIEARRFDPATGDTTGAPRRIAEGVGLRSPVFLYAEYDASADGTLMTIGRTNQGAPTDMLHLIGVGGRDEPRAIPVGVNRITNPRFSPDGSRILAIGVDFATRLQPPFVYDPERGVVTRLPGGDAAAADWTTNGDSVVTVATSNDVSIQSVRGGEAPHRIGALRGWGNIIRVDARSPWAVFEGDREGSIDIGAIPRDSGDRPRPLLATPANERWPRVSPDGRRIAFTVVDNGHSAVHVASFPSLTDRIVASAETGGGEPKWSRDGTLFYVDAARQVMAVSFKSGVQLAIASRRPLGIAIPSIQGWDVDPTGRRFVYASGQGSPGLLKLIVTLNAIGGTPPAAPSKRNTP